MLLPKMKYKESAYQQEVIPFLGINYSDNFRIGELAQAKNLSDVRYPYLSPRNPRGKEEKTSPTAIFSWDGKLILVDGTTLYYDGEAVGTVSAGEKQFAVVNTKLCIWPDKAYLDLKTKEFGRLDATIQNAQGTKAIFTENSVQINGEFARVSSDYLKVWQTNISNDGTLTRTYSSVAGYDFEIFRLPALKMLLVHDVADGLGKHTYKVGPHLPGTLPGAKQLKVLEEFLLGILWAKLGHCLSSLLVLVRVDHTFGDQSVPLCHALLLLLGQIIPPLVGFGICGLRPEMGQKLLDAIGGYHT